MFKLPSPHIVPPRYTKWSLCLSFFPAVCISISFLLCPTHITPVFSCKKSVQLRSTSSALRFVAEVNTNIGTRVFAVGASTLFTTSNIKSDEYIAKFRRQQHCLSTTGPWCINQSDDNWNCLLRYVTLRYVTLRYVTLRYVTLRYVTLRYVTLRYVTLPYLTLPYLTLPSLPYLTLPYLTLPYLTLPYLTLPYLTLPYLTLPYLTLPYLTLPYLTLPYLTLPYLRILTLP